MSNSYRGIAIDRTKGNLSRAERRCTLLRMLLQLTEYANISADLLILRKVNREPSSRFWSI